MSAVEVATAVGYGDRPARQRRLITWKPLVRGSLRGFSTVEISSIRLRIVDVPVLLGSNGAWAILPAKLELDSEGRRKLDINVKPTWASAVEWKSRELRERFSGVVVAAVRRAYPGNLD
jgi:hypothetical protein